MCDAIDFQIFEEINTVGRTMATAQNGSRSGDKFGNRKRLREKIISSGVYAYVGGPHSSGRSKPLDYGISYHTLRQKSKGGFSPPLSSLNMAAFHAALLQIPLVIFLGPPKSGCRRNFRSNGL
jgi:hypothetical protein